VGLSDQIGGYFYSANKLHYFLRIFNDWIIFMKKYDNFSFSYLTLKNKIKKLGNTVSNRTQTEN
jgi:hypothetical protein